MGCLQWADGWAQAACQAAGCVELMRGHTSGWTNFRGESWSISWSKKLVRPHACAGAEPNAARAGSARGRLSVSGVGHRGHQQLLVLQRAVATSRKLGRPVQRWHLRRDHVITRARGQSTSTLADDSSLAHVLHSAHSQHQCLPACSTKTAPLGLTL